MSLLPHEEIETASEPDFSIIWLHGLGASGHDFVPIVPELNLPKGARVRFLFPHAPARPVTVNGGVEMPSWYDIYSLDIDRKIDRAQIQLSVQQIHDFIDREIERGIESERILLAGFSQGGAVAYQAALTYPKSLAGLIAMSTYLATPEDCVVTEPNKTLPIFIQHGDADPVVPEALGQKANRLLQELGLNSLYKTYPMQHEVCFTQIADLSAWLSERLVKIG